MSKYQPKKIEKKWQKYWEENGTFKDYSRKEKFYALDMFPYPSGAGLHVGHPKGYVATDIVARFEHMRGKSVLHPMGWDAFGLPAENYAIKNKIHPKKAVEENIAHFKEQLEKIGFTYDWDWEINTTDPEYYRWTQWIFLQMFKKGLAYESEEPVNWCANCKTVLANEDLEQGKCERCGGEITQRPLRQWVLRMTEYADRLLKDLDTEDVHWEKSIIEQQKNWIGRSNGVVIKFPLVIARNEESSTSDEAIHLNPGSLRSARDDEVVEVFTTRVDTIFGCTYIVLSPEHKWIMDNGKRIKNWEEVGEYIEQAKKKTAMERGEMNKEKTGVRLEGVEAVNPFTGESVPVFVADYVLGSYGTGAVMAVPAHDERDLEFAKRYDLPIKVVVKSEKDYENIQTDSLESLLKMVFTKAKEQAFFAVLVGGAAKSLRNTGMLGKHSDIDIFVDKKGFTILEKYFIENGYNSTTRDEKGDVHEWNNHKWFWRDGEWIDLFIVEKEGELLFDNVGTEKNDWGVSREVIDHIEFDSVSVSIPSEEVMNRIDFVLSHNWNYCFTDGGILARSGEYSGLTSEEAREKMADWLEENGNGSRSVKYKMRDWVFSRQRYWGEPIPIIHCEKCGAVGVPEDQLPVTLPDVASYEPTDTGESPLANIEDWVNTTCPECGGPAKRETNTMPQWAGSSWYYLAYTSAKRIMDKGERIPETGLQKMRSDFNEWLPVDLYVGGAEHATRHLLYARFWHKFLYDIGVVGTKEPFKRLVHVGLIGAEDGRKMSKRWGNVINPDDVVREFGADSLRLYEMFMGPFTQNIAWSTESLSGTRRFLEKVWRIFQRITDNGGGRMSESPSPSARGLATPPRAGGEEILVPLVHKTIKKVTEDIENFRFNTAISALMILANRMEKENDISTDHYRTFTLLLAPFAPHIAEELWQKLGHKTSIFLKTWPEYDGALIQDETITLVLQVNGKVRDKIEVTADISEEEAKKIALESENVQKFIEGKEPKKLIYVPGRLVNVVV